MNIHMVSFTLGFCLLSPFPSFAYDNEKTHPALTAEAVNNTALLETVLKDQLGFAEGAGQGLNNGNETREITEWLQDGSKEEDEPNCRASNHFHDPLKPWDESMLTDPLWYVDLYCGNEGLFTTKHSNISWATGIKDAAGNTMPETVNGISAPENWNGRNWLVARELYYNALTEENPQQREAFFAETFKTIGYVLHLLEDMAVPAHTRNDFSEGHSQNIGCPDGGWFCEIKWKGNPYEGYVRDHFDDEILPLISSDISKPFTGEKTLTNFWDTEIYTPGTGPSTSTTQGLAEYTNSNFVSQATIFKTQSDDPLHAYPYPDEASVAKEGYPDEVDLRILVKMSKDGQMERLTYLSKNKHGETIDRFLKPRYLTSGTEWTYGNQVSNHFELEYYLDDGCFQDYAVKLIPRAIGYSAALLDYFFRGIIKVTGVSLTLDSNKAVSQLDVTLKNETLQSDSSIEPMSNGTFSFVCRYTDSAGIESFQFLENVYQVTDENDPINVGEITLSVVLDVAIPHSGVDPECTLVYRGKLGAEEDAVAGKIFSLGPAFAVNVVPWFSDSNNISNQGKILLLEISNQSDRILRNGNFTLQYSLLTDPAVTGSASCGTIGCSGTCEAQADVAEIIEGGIVTLQFYLPDDTWVSTGNFKDIQWNLHYDGDIDNQGTIGYDIAFPTGEQRIQGWGDILFNEEWEESITGYPENDWLHGSCWVSAGSQGTHVFDGNIDALKNILVRIAPDATSYALSCSSRIDLDLTVTGNSWLLLNVFFSLESPVQVDGVDKQDQFVQFTFNDAYTLIFYDAAISLDAWPPSSFIDDPRVIYVPVNPGVLVAQNVMSLFTSHGITVPEQLTLSEIKFIQEMEVLDTAPADTQTMMIAADAVRLINVSEGFNYCQ